MSKPWRIATAVGVFVIAALGVMFAVLALAKEPPTVDYAAGHQAGQPVDVTLQTVGAYGLAPHPTWVSYMTKTPQGQWVHTTLWQIPAHTRINVTIYNYDSGSPLRNQQIGLIRGTTGNIATLNGKPIRLVNSNAGNGVGHTFSIPTLGINVPLYGNNANANLCAVAPCSTKSPNQVIKFSFISPGPGQYPWQCFVPCALGFLYGNGGPMQTIGYMDGFMKVVS